MERMTKQLSRRSDDAEAGAFIGFDSSSDSDDSHEEVCADLIEKILWKLYIFLCLFIFTD